jgi:hypothetical protein
MRCYCCNKVLTTTESVRRFKESGTFVDMCNGCLSTLDSDIETVESDNLEEDEYEDQDE